MCGDRTPQHQPPFYYYVVQGPEKDNSHGRLQWWLNSLRTAYNNLFDIWSQKPPCSGECLIMGGASDAWVTYGHSTARSVYFQLRAFAAFDPNALPNACGSKGVMLRFGGMTLNGNIANCYGIDNWGQTSAACPTTSTMSADFQRIVTQADDEAFFDEVGAPGDIVLETDGAVVTISVDTGVEVKHKEDSCPQPTLDFAWRCAQEGGVSDPQACHAGTPPSPPTPPVPPTPPTPPPVPPPSGWKPCSPEAVHCCNPDVSPKQFCPGGIPCGHCGGNACACPTTLLV